MLYSLPLTMLDPPVPLDLGKIAFWKPRYDKTAQKIDENGPWEHGRVLFSQRRHSPKPHMQVDVARDLLTKDDKMLEGMNECK
jgi:hypothetical protein